MPRCTTCIAECFTKRPRRCQPSFYFPLCAISDSSSSSTPFTTRVTAGTQTDMWQTRSQEGPGLALCLPTDPGTGSKILIVGESQSISSPVRQLYHYLSCIFDSVTDIALTTAVGVSHCALIISPHQKGNVRLTPQKYTIPRLHFRLSDSLVTPANESCGGNQVEFIQFGDTGEYQ